MITNLSRIPETNPLQRLHSDIVHSFFMNIEDSTEFNDDLFSEWLPRAFSQKTDIRDWFEAIYLEYKKIDDDNERGQLIQFFVDSNRVEDLCNRIENVNALKILRKPEGLYLKLKELFSYLWRDALKHPGFNEHVGYSKPTYIRHFIRHNGFFSICPLCGIEGLVFLEGQATPALDHWLDKATYPFSAVNFDNLFPIGQCNSVATKGTKDVLRDIPNDRAYYPTTPHEGITICFRFINEPISLDISEDDWELTITPNSNDEQHIFNSWSYIFNIDKTYKSFIKEYVLLNWKSIYRRYIEKNPRPPNHASDIRELKENFQDWKRSIDETCVPGGLLYHAFIDYLIDSASDLYLTSLLINLPKQEIP